MEKSNLIIAGSIVAGAGAGYFIAVKLKKNCWICSAIGAVVGGVAGYSATKFIFTGEKKSGFVVNKIGDSCYCSSGAGAGSYSPACCNKK